MEKLKDHLSERLDIFLSKLAEFVPDLLVIVIIIVSGFVTAAIARRLASRLLGAVKFDRWSEEIGLTTALRKTGILTPPARFISLFLYWFVVILFFMAGFATLGFRVTDTLASLFFLYIPKFFSAVLVIVFGYFIATFASRAVLISAVNSGIEYARLLSESVRLVLLILVLAMALEQLAIAPRIVFAAFSIFFGSIGLALALALGIGGRNTARKMIEFLVSKRDTKNNIDQL